MKTPFALLGLVVCALPLLAGEAERRVAAPCELTTATVIASGKQTEAAGREFAVRVINLSPQTIALPSSPAFGWRVESLEKGSWRLQAEGGPVRRVHPRDAQDGHVVVVGDPGKRPAGGDSSQSFQGLLHLPSRGGASPPARGRQTPP